MTLSMAASKCFSSIFLAKDLAAMSAASLQTFAISAPKKKRRGKTFTITIYFTIMIMIEN